MSTKPNSPIARDLESVVHPFSNLAALPDHPPTMITHGKGIYVYDDNGKEYMEGASGMWCASLGFGEEELIELSSGCICCVVRGDLIRGLRSLLADRPELDGIIIETTGLANPSPVIQTLVIDQVIGAQCRLDSVLCVVDAVHILDQPAGHAVSTTSGKCSLSSFRSL